MPCPPASLLAEHPIVETPPEERLSMIDPRHQTAMEREYARRLPEYFRHSPGSDLDKLRNFPKFLPQQSLNRFLARHAMFERVLKVHGHIIECGVFLGAGLMTWAQFSSIYEPYNHIRRVVGFDTFSGFGEIDTRDRGDNPEHAMPGGLCADVYDDLQECIELYDMNRPLGHMPRVELVKGDACQTIPTYLEENPHLVVAMLYLDFDVYQPTKAALEYFVPRMPKGAILAFDELNQKSWPGETVAVMETLGLRNLRIEHFPFTSNLSFAVLE